MICCTKIDIFNGMVTLLPARSFIQYDLIRVSSLYVLSVVEVLQEQHHGEMEVIIPTTIAATTPNIYAQEQIL